MSPTAAHRLGSLHPGLGGFQPRGELEESGLPSIAVWTECFQNEPKQLAEAIGDGQGLGMGFLLLKCPGLGSSIFVTVL